MSQMQQTLDALGVAFEEFKAANDKRLKEIAENGAPLADTEAKLDKINAEMDRLRDVTAEIEKTIQRPGSLGPSESDEAKAAFRKSFQAWMRKGRNEDEMQALAVKAAVNTGTDADGGYAVPEEIDSEVMRQIGEATPMRQICMVVSVGTPDYKKLMSIGGTGSGWVGETAARPETNSPQLGEVAPTFGEVYANPASTQHALDDIFFDVEAWIAREVAIEFAEQENAAFTTGDGTDKPTGFLAAPNSTDPDATRTFGTLQYVVTGAAGGFNPTDPHEALIDLAYAVKAGYRVASRWVTNRATLGEIRKMKDGDGNLIWRPGLEPGQPDTILGYPITENEDMPAIAPDSLSVGFGDFMRGYLIADRVGMRTLRDPYTNKPYVHFYSTMRVGGKVHDSNAIKLLKFGTT